MAAERVRGGAVGVANRNERWLVCFGVVVAPGSGATRLIMLTPGGCRRDSAGCMSSDYGYLG